MYNEIILNQYRLQEEEEKKVIDKYNNKLFICKNCCKNFKIINKNGLIKRYKKLMYYIDKYYINQSLMCFKCKKE